MDFRKGTSGGAPFGNIGVENVSEVRIFFAQSEQGTARLASMQVFEASDEGSLPYKTLRKATRQIFSVKNFARTNSSVVMAVPDFAAANVVFWSSGGD